ncbi:MAG: DUF1501 domain-containing protein [Planctomyces sp.]|jgi:hypothetical protein|nr:DUF1501 domain-containing protein [Planctomyces sp.]
MPHRYATPPITHLPRRALLAEIGGGFGFTALTDLLAADEPGGTRTGPPPESDGLHHPARVRRVIQLFMTGGASPMDLFDYKPELERLHGQMIGPKDKPEGFTAPAGAVMKSPFKFAQYGDTGRWVSELFPQQAKVIDEPAFLMAMTGRTNVHGPASYLACSGFTLPGFPCFGAWVSYGLGSLSDNMPAFVVLPDPRGLPYNQKGNFSAGFLPSNHQGTVVDASASPPIADLQADSRYAFARDQADRDTLTALQNLNRRHAARYPGDSRFDARIAAAELAAAMQLSAPEAFNLAAESETTQQSYGLNQPETQDFGRRCLLARRLIERGTRFVQVWSGPQGAVNNWDNHGNIQTELPPMARSVDQPIAALITDLLQRGLLSDTLLIWTTEFGRTPFAQGSLGRDHNSGTFVTWLAGAGIRKGTNWGRSDDLAYQTAEGKTWGYDLHATILHLMGIDHHKLTFRNSGIDRRLTDVHGRVIHEILSG